MQVPISTTPSLSASDRRPIAARSNPIFQRLAQRLASANVSANAISIAGMICGILGGAALVGTRFVPEFPARFLWAAAAGLVQLRLLANMLDGMVALESGTASSLGEIYNDVPDRISDSAILIGAGYAAGSMPILGWLAALLAMLTAYVRAVGKAAGAGSDFCGPMAKPQRMFFITVLGLFSAIAPGDWLRVRPPLWILALIVVGSAVTALRRLAHLSGKLRSKP